MSGHSKWANIKHRKGAQDARRAKLFTRIGREIQTAAREGGGDPGSNARLRAAVLAGRSVNMPSDNIERAIKRGTGELEGVHYEEVVYEGFGPGGVAILVQALTDNRNRTTSEMRFLFTRHGGDLGGAGSVAWMFERRGYLEVGRGSVSEEALTEAVLEAGGDDLRVGDEVYEVYSAPSAFHAVRDALEKAGLKPANAELTMMPQNTVSVDPERRGQLLALLEALDDHDDVQQVAANCDP
ncbi:MAG: YebC/PmpR family DNA-binding transcriptional regulator [Acidobacteria bacterium]|jgi:YebC/PmpR family DNA-binding regulatory protein|nr:YebC/PmpR family DNA-binding transcriptional regulator [Acidobacteriota bacterium]MCU0254336.1 YebC/PmpR family DNA-binding transcriptional regulator [Acidobacteriota bacterium]